MILESTNSGEVPMEKQSSLKGFTGFAAKSMVVQTLTYFAFGLIMSSIFDYKALFQMEIIRDFMRPMDSPYVMAGPFLQPLRGLLFAIIIWPIRGFLLERKNGWLILWGVFVIFGVLGTPAAAPCSMEGVIYSKLPLWFHLIGLPEMLLQTLCFSFLFLWWLKRPAKENTIETMGRKKAILLKIMFAVMIGCFAYIGYAIGSLISAWVAGVHIKLGGEALAFKRQFMFVFAFIINVIGILIITGKSILGRLSNLRLFILFWIIDTSAILIYQFLFLHPMPIYLAILIGIFPSLAIVISHKINYKNFLLINNVLAR
jgi:hypothetical protein